jgi:methylase of polypeptide subunit release factors
MAPTGLDEVRRLLTPDAGELAPGGWLLMEFGFGQGDAVRAAVNAVPDLELVEDTARSAGPNARS